MARQTFTTTEERGHKFEQAVVPVSAPVWDTLFKGVPTGSDAISFSGDLEGTSGMALVVGIVGGTAATDTITIKFYMDRDKTMQYGSDVSVAVSAATTGTSAKTDVSFTDWDYVRAYEATGTNTSTGTKYELYLVKLPLV